MRHLGPGMTDSKPHSVIDHSIRGVSDRGTARSATTWMIFFRRSYSLMRTDRSRLMPSAPSLIRSVEREIPKIADARLTLPSTM